MLSTPQFLFIDELKREFIQSIEYQEKCQKYNTDPTSMLGFTLSNGLLLHKGRIWIPSNSRFKLLLMKEFHETPIGGHAGVLKTHKRLSANFTWDSMRKDISSFIADCMICQQTKYSTQKLAGLLQPLPLPTQIWEDLSLDFVTGLPISGGYSVLLVVVDRFSKSVHLGALPSHYTTYKVAELFVSMVCKLHGLPKSIVSDRDPIFISKFWADLFKFSGTLLRKRSSYHPQPDGQTEVTNRTIEQYLRAFVHHKPSLWYKYLPWAEYHYNTSYHTAAGITPYQIVYGKPPSTLLDYVAGSSPVDASDALLLSRAEILELLEKNLTKARLRMKEIADGKRREIHFKVDDWVHVKLQPYRQGSLSSVKYNKLNKRFYGPYRILAGVGPVAYKLELPSHAKIHNVFHCSLLKQYSGPIPPTVDQLPPDSVDNNPIVSPLAILSARTTIQDGLSCKQVLVQWNGLLPEDTTWEDWEILKQNYNIEDKVNFDGVGIVTSPSSIDGPIAANDIGPAKKRPTRNRKMPIRFNDHIVYK